jgi:nucleotide-binding universal stress UspA family protein
MVTSASAPAGHARTRAADASPVVVVGVDGTRSGQVALQAAVDRARALGGRLLAVHVPPPAPFLWSMSLALAGPVAEWRHELEEAAFLDTAQAAGTAGVGWDFTVDLGDVAGVLARQARRRQAAALVVAAGARHRHAHRCPARRLTALRDVSVLVAASGEGCTRSGAGR